MKPLEKAVIKSVSMGYRSLSDAIVALYQKEGRSIRDIARYLGCSRAFVQRQLRENGVPILRAPIQPARSNKKGIFLHGGKIRAVAGRKVGDDKWSWIRCVECHEYLDKRKPGDSDSYTSWQVRNLIREHRCKGESKND